MPKLHKVPQPRTLSIFRKEKFTSERVSKFLLQEPTDYYVTWELSACSEFVSALLDFGFGSANQIRASPMIGYVMSRHLVADWL